MYPVPPFFYYFKNFLRNLAFSCTLKFHVSMNYSTSVLIVLGNQVNLETPVFQPWFIAGVCSHVLSRCFLDFNLNIGLWGWFAFLAFPYYKPNFCVLPKTICWNLPPNMTWGDGAFRGGWVRRLEPPPMGLVPPKSDSASSFTPSEGGNWTWCSTNQEVDPHQEPGLLAFWSWTV